MLTEQGGVNTKLPREVGDLLGLVTVFGHERPKSRVDAQVNASHSACLIAHTCKYMNTYDSRASHIVLPEPSSA